MTQIGSLKFRTSNGDVEIPIFLDGDSSSAVSECLKVETGDNTGFIALVEPSDAAFPYIRIQTQNGLKAVHDSSSILNVFFSEEFEENNLNSWNLHSTGSTGNSGTNSSSAPDGGSYHGYVSQKSGGGDWAEIYTSNSYDWNNSYQFQFLVSSRTWDNGDFNKSSIGWRGRRGGENVIGLQYLSTDGTSNEQPFRFLGSGTSNSTEYQMSWDKDIWYWIRGEVNASTKTAEAKIWKAGGTEPNNYQISCDITTGNFSGEVHIHSNGDSSYRHENDVAQIKFGQGLF